MKIEIITNKPKLNESRQNPRPNRSLKEVVLTLSPREAYLLKTLVGNMCDTDVLKVLRYNSCGSRVYLTHPIENAPKSLVKDTNIEEARIFNNTMFSVLSDAMEKAGKMGCE